MKRILLSIGSGLVSPILYILLVWSVSSVVKFFNPLARGDSWWFYLLAMPVEWGGRFYNFLFPARFESPYALLRSPAILSDLGGAFLLFAVLTYVILWHLSRRKRLASLENKS